MPDSRLPVLSVDGTPALLQYSVGDEVEAVNTPKPHVHPLRTPAGVVVTDFAPEDHPWHMGLQFGIPWVGEDNFWGGGSYLGPDQGYVVIPNQGAIRQEDSAVVEMDGGALLTARLNWMSDRSSQIIAERREITASLKHGAEGPVLVVDHVSHLSNPSAHAVDLGTPAQKGRADGGYGGMFLRLAPSFEVLEASTELGPALESGHRGRVFTVHGRIDGSDVTIGLADLEGSGVPASRWLYRFEPFPAIGWAVMYEDGISLAAEGSITFAHRLVIADGLLDAAVVEELALS